jgi:hypothetical protein
VPHFLSSSPLKRHPNRWKGEPLPLPLSFPLLFPVPDILIKGEVKWMTCHSFLLIGVCACSETDELLCAWCKLGRDRFISLFFSSISLVFTFSGGICLAYNFNLWLELHLIFLRPLIEKFYC